MFEPDSVAKLDGILRNAKKAAILSHFSPDGDAAGSTAAFREYALSRGIRAQVILPSPLSDNFSFLDRPDCPTMICEADRAAAEAVIADADLIVCLDFNALSRTEYLEAAVTASKAPKVMIDHHVAQDAPGFDLVIATTEVSSACELLFHVLMEMPDIAADASRLTPLCRDALYTGMMTDTNNFSNSVFPGTLRMASALLACGVDKMGLQEKVFNVYTESRMRLMGHILLNKMQVLPQYGLAYMILTQAEKDAFDYQVGDSEGFVNLPLSIASVRMSALFTETTQGHIRVSLRSKQGTDVNVLARKFFNGGGHVNASGGRLYIPVDEIPAYLSKSLEEHFGR